ncbi:F-box only protein 16 [Plakobranchus ocellatus]|uniref:F-box only protein 16 n=1 Tax=Plakobranchus ocellatus TaxID=259542 RepID=A0AAV4DKZ9_9GAST|nr:F-box only protein 16 [Plakobranchus ocellatus]
MVTIQPCEPISLEKTAKPKRILDLDLDLDLVPLELDSSRNSTYKRELGYVIHEGENEAEPRMSMIAKNRIHSSWTPLSDADTNNKIFEERKNLVAKWFSKWTDDQRRKMFDELVALGRRKQLEYARELIDSRVPCHKDDFTRYLPRVITLYIFSFLDARSLCQCARVCWYWRYLSELDQLWMPKCVHFGWYLSFTPSPYENGVWKRNFTEQFKIFQALMPKTHTTSTPHSSDKRHNPLNKSGKGGKKGPTPWRGSDPVPMDTWRFNYLNNDEVVEEVNKVRQRKAYGTSTADIIRNAKSKINTGSNVLNTMPRSQSLTRVSSTDGDFSERPRWARQGAPSSSSQFVHKNAMKQNGVLASITRPSPVSPLPRPLSSRQSKVRPGAGEGGTSRPVTARSARDPPTTELFPQTPWKVPDDVDSDDEAVH